MKFCGLFIFSFLFLFFWLFAFQTQAANLSDCVNINTAPEKELEKIIHIGEARAEQIINLRGEAFFISLDDLERVNGIGSSRIASIKEQGLACVEKPQPEPLPPLPEPEPELLKVDINAASLKDLQKIVGIGSVLAQRIIDARPFYSLDDLAKVMGIGPTTLKDIKKQGLAWVDPQLAPPPKTEETKTSQPQIASAALNEKIPEDSSSLLILLVAITLSISSGIIIILLKRGLIH